MKKFIKRKTIDNFICTFAAQNQAKMGNRKSKSKKGKAFRWILAILIFVLIALFAGSEYMLNFALHPTKNKGRNYNKELAVMKSRYRWIDSWIDSLQKSNALRDTFVIASDGDRHHAIYAYAPKATPNTAVIVPGYTDCAIDMLHIGYIYNKVLDMNILIPDLHANGKSKGKTMQMGWKDRKDVLQWIGIANNIFKSRNGNTRMVVHGQSMGAATVMNVSGETTPDYVKCFVEDCGYTSAWDEFGYELKDMFGLPEVPLLYSASALCKLQYGWSFGEASPIKQVAKCHKPMLFIHGGGDTFVPTRMVFPLYNAKPGPKYLMVLPHSHHARSYRDHREVYERRIVSYVRKYI